MEVRKKSLLKNFLSHGGNVIHGSSLDIKKIQTPGNRKSESIYLPQYPSTLLIMEVVARAVRACLIIHQM